MHGKTEASALKHSLISQRSEGLRRVMSSIVCPGMSPVIATLTDAFGVSYITNIKEESGEQMSGSDPIFRNG